MHSENFFGDGGAALAVLEAARERWPISLHGVGLSLGSAAGVDEVHLDQLARLVQRFDPVRVSDHASFARAARHAGHAPVHANDLLPLAFTEASLDILVRNVQRVQERLRRPLLVENLSAYLHWADDTLPEPEFFNRLARRSGCGLLLDVNNLVVNALNDGADAVAAACRWIDAIDADAVGEIHLAGHADGRATGGMVIDDHGCLAGLPPCRETPGRAADADRVGHRPAAAARAAGRGGAGRSRYCRSRFCRRHHCRSRRADRMSSAGEQKEALRQQMLLRALWRDARPGVVAGWMRDPPERFARGLQVYQAHAGALAQRALEAAYPTLAELIGADSFAGLARAFWQADPPRQGDIASWGAALPDFVAAAASLADEPCLADVARIDWAVHRATTAADHDEAVSGLELLAAADPAPLQLRLRPGTAVLRSAHPAATIWLAHRSSDVDRFASVRQALAEQRAEATLVWRDGGAVRVAAIAEAEAMFTETLIAGGTLGAAFDAAARAPGLPLDFEAWLIAALQQGRLVAVQARRADEGVFA